MPEKPFSNHSLFWRPLDKGNAPPGGGTLAAATSAVVLRGNELRKRVTIVNGTGAVMYAAMGELAIDGRGFLVNPGGVFTIQPDTLGYLWPGAVSLISAPGGDYTLTEES